MSYENCTNPSVLWGIRQEKKFFQQRSPEEWDALWSLITCKNCDYSTSQFLYKPSGFQCPKCKSGVSVSSPGARNTIVQNCTEKFTGQTLQEALSLLQENGGMVSPTLKVYRNISCPALGRSKKDGQLLDLGIVDEELLEPGQEEIPPEALKMAGEVKMSIPSNWQQRGQGPRGPENIACVGACFEHQARPSFGRTDSMKKAIGDGGTLKSHLLQYNKTRVLDGKSPVAIPFIIIGNSMPPKTYLQCGHIDAMVDSGHIDGVWSLNPNPLEAAAQPQQAPDRYHIQQSKKGGFKKANHLLQLSLFVEDALTNPRHCIGAVSQHALGELHAQLLETGAELTREKLIDHLHLL